MCMCASNLSLRVLLQPPRTLRTTHTAYRYIAHRTLSNTPHTAHADSIFPTLYLVFSISTGLYGQRGTDLCNLMNINPTKEPCKDIQAIAILPMLVETLFGGKTFSKILLKLATRLTP